MLLIWFIKINKKYLKAKFFKFYKNNIYLYVGGGFPWATHGSCVKDPSSVRTWVWLNVTLGSVEACGSKNKYKIKLHNAVIFFFLKKAWNINNITLTNKTELNSENMFIFCGKINPICN